METNISKYSIKIICALLLFLIIMTSFYESQWRLTQILIGVVISIVALFIDVQTTEAFKYKKWYDYVVYVILSIWAYFSFVALGRLHVGILTFLSCAIFVLLSTYYLSGLTQLFQKKSYYTGHSVISVHPFIKFSAVYTLVSAVWIWAYFPGYLDTDSANQWLQVQSGHWSDWHPVINTWLIKAMTLIYNSPISMIILQVLCYVLLMSYLMSWFVKHHVPNIVIVSIFLFTVFVPYFSLISIFLTKDVLFSYALVLLVLQLIDLIKTDGQSVRTPLGFFMLTAIILFFVLSRHNDTVILALTWIFLVFIFHQKGDLVVHASFVIGIGLSLVITGPVYKAFHVTPATPGEAYAIPTQIMGAVYTQNGKMSRAEKKTIERITPANVWRQSFLPYDVDPIKFTQYDEKYVGTHPVNMIKTTLGISLKNPKISVKEYFKQTSLIWRSQLDYPYQTLGFSHSRMDPYFKNTVYNKRNELLHQKMENFVNWTFSSAITIWIMPATLLIAILYMLYLLFKARKARYIFAFIPFVANILTFALAIPAPVLRYFYSNYLIFVVLCGFIMSDYVIASRDGKNSKKTVIR